MPTTDPLPMTDSNALNAVYARAFNAFWRTVQAHYPTVAGVLPDSARSAFHHTSLGAIAAWLHANAPGPVACVNAAHPEYQYLDLLREALEHGSPRMDRTGVGTRALFGRELRFDLGLGFPAFTTKRVAFRVAVGEMLGFIEGADSAARFRELGVKIWDANANENAQWLANPHRRGTDDLGPIYGVQWRRLPMPDGSTRDQLAELIDKLRNNPADRRLLCWAYNPAYNERMALPPCHMGFQVFVDGNRLSMKVYKRSTDLLLGLPFNALGYAALAHMLAQVANLVPHELILSMGDAHLYENHLDQVREQLSRVPRPWPTLALDTSVRAIDDFRLEHFRLEGYDPHPAIKAPMAV
jgi:thymidylate synthase